MRVFSTLFKVLIVVIATAIISQRSSAQNTESKNNRPIKIQRINSPVKLDGLSNEAAWDGIKSLPTRTLSPDYNNEPSERTEILLGYDNDYLYAAGRLYYSDPSKIRVQSLQRDVWTYSTDAMAIIIDAFKDNENAVVFFTTPAGTRTDVNILNVAEGAPTKNVNTNWNTFWDVAHVCNDDGWFTEIRIPFSSLRFEQKDGQTVMGITAYRFMATNNEMDIFPLIPQKFGFWGAFKPSLTQKVLFEGIKSHNPLYITPYILGGLEQSYKLNDVNTAYEKGNKFARELGLDIKYGLSNNLTLDVTINPDFAQVEADDQQINLTRYSLFFPEKRRFFQEREGNFIFNFEDDNRLFYSRRIGLHEGELVRIYGGARVVGRVGPWDIGFLNMQTEKFKDLPSENFNVLRVRKQVINPYSYIGGMVTSRIGNKNSWNTAYGIDGIFNLFGDDYLTLKWAQSFENDLTNQVGSLVPAKIYSNWIRRSKEGMGYNLSYSRSGEDFNPGIGYERRDNYTRFGDRVQYGWIPTGEESKILNHQVFIEGFAFIRNDDKKIESSQTGIGWQFNTDSTNSFGSIVFNQFKEDLTKSFSLSDDAEVPKGKYTFYGLVLKYNPIRGNPYRINTNIEAGSFYDGRLLSVSLTPIANISAHVQIEGKYQIKRVQFPDRNQKFTGHIGRLKVSAFLNSKLSLKTLVQYNSSIDKIITNVRFRFNPQEGHDLYVVYNEDFNTNRQREFPTLPGSNTRTIMVKYNYTFKIGL